MAVTDLREGRVRARPRADLPAQASSFVGRERELDYLGHMLASGRLLTLTGPGGCGKTRLALQAAAHLAEDFEDGVVFVELATLSNPELVAEGVARALGLRMAGASPAEALLDYLESRATLLVLDNCEHLIEACAGLADELLRSCPGLKILATSREALRIPGERAWLVPSLSLPDVREEIVPERLTRHEAVRLFVERAAAAVPGFQLDEHNAPAVARICQRLDGIPLAIELAAVKVRVLSASQIAARLDDRFLLLTDGSRVALPRQRTLLATMDWGHELLSERERALFRRISAFSNGFTLEAAEEVCSEGGVERGEVLELLGRLVDKSLVLVETRGENARYRMLESVGQYASRKLEGSGEERSVRSRHAGFYLRLAERAEPALSGPDQGAWIDRLDAEVGNLRAAMSWFRTAEDTEAGLRLASALWGFCHARGYYETGRAWLEDALATSGDPTSLRAGALRGAGLLAFLQCDYTGAGEHLGHSLSLYKDLADRCGVASVKDVLGGVAREQGDYGRARKLHEESLALWRELEDEHGIAESLYYLGLAAWLNGENERAGDLSARALDMTRDSGDAAGILSSLLNLGSVALYEEDYDRAETLLDESLAISREGGYREGVGWALNQLGMVAYHRGDLEQAGWYLRESLAVHEDLGDLGRVASVLEALAEAAAASKHFGRSARLFGAAEALRESTGVPVPPCENPEYDRALAAVRTRVGDGEFSLLRAEGRSMKLEAAVSLALEPDVAPPTLASQGVLSARETEVLGLVAEGLTDQEVAQRLYLSPRTVGQHLSSVYRKLGVRSRTAATHEATERGILK
ncbi:MAG TPA: tetratricopeptide repeat protein [Rubrobacter sp.]|nr:tetratricopeptide repeat protein [Rubrobacter sp.]